MYALLYVHVYVCAYVLYAGAYGSCVPVLCLAYVELPDGKVISGTEWGNFLLWDGGFIKVEIAKKGKKSCHHVRTMHACVCMYFYIHTMS